ncbi:MAG: EscE/YscE/SsaE family type III secretion system needle protein co-chaperone [Candidimonas sp.]|jgi:hypothetical protein
MQEAIIDLEARLAGPEGGALRSQIRQALHTAESRLRANVKQGLSPADFQVSTALADAFLAAQEILDRHSSSGKTS